MHVRRFAAGLLACVTFAACSDNSTTAPTAPSNNDTPALARAHTGPLVTQLTNLAVVGAANNVNPLVRGLTGTFTGAATITSFASNAAGQLLANGTITGTATFVTAAGQTITADCQPGVHQSPSDARRCQLPDLSISTWPRSSSTSLGCSSIPRRSS